MRTPVEIKPPEEVMRIIESIDDVPSMIAHVLDVVLASAMARYGDLDARRLLNHLVPIAESDPSGFEGRAGLMCLELLDLIADEIRNSPRPEDEALVRRVEALQP